MRVWEMAGRGPARAVATEVVADLIGCVGTADFGNAALAGLSPAVDAGSWSVYRVHADKPPALCASASRGIPDTTQDCFRVYREGLYLSDRSLVEAHATDGAAVMTLCRADDIQAVQREQIYQRYGMRERLSIVAALPDGLLAVNLYRHAHQPGFGDGDIEALRQVGPGLLACVRRHIDWHAAKPTEIEPLEALRRHCPTLTDRELQVCGGLLRGWTHDGIAADLGLSVTTVKTYRNRAFDRLGIHFRNQLFDVVRAGGIAMH